MNTRNDVMKHHWLHLAVYLHLACCYASLSLAETPHVALMPSGDLKAAAIVELMEAELAQREDLVLLDRANVGRIRSLLSLSGNQRKSLLSAFRKKEYF